MASEFNISLPQPCAEDWHQMTPAQRGRYCQACKKVVRDFTESEAAAIHQEIVQSASPVCGRVPSRILERNDRLVYLFAKFPVQRLRVFLFAFVMAFGLEVWGLSPVQAQSIQPAVEVLKNQDSLQSAFSDSSAQFQIKGLVQDVYTREPVALVSIMVYDGEQFVSGVFSDAEGKFELTVPANALSADTFDLHLSYLGKTRMDKGIHSDHREFAYLIDASMMMKGLSIEGRGQPWVTGVLVSRRTVEMTPFQFNDKALYRPLDEWLMMHNSEIHHSGRW